MDTMTQAPTTQQLLMQLGTGFWVTQCMAVAARLNLLEALSAGPRSAVEMAHEKGLHAPSVARLLRGCATVGITQEISDGVFLLTELGDGLTLSNPASMRGALEMMADPGHWNSWGQLEHTVRTGEAAYRKALNVENVFEYYDNEPEEQERFNRAMGSLTSAFIRCLEKSYDFADYPVIADIGGGQGRLLGSLLQWAPQSRGILFDQASVIEGAPVVLAEMGVSQRVKLHSGSFFEEIPAAADLYVAKHVLHDWDDERCVQILQNIRSVIPAQGRLLIMDCVLPEPPEVNPSIMMDLNMMVMTGGRERRASEFASLLAQAGFQLGRVVSVPGMTQLVEARPSASS